MTNARKRIYAEVEGRRFPIRQMQAMQLVLFGLEAQREGKSLDFELVFVKDENAFAFPVTGMFANPDDQIGDGNAVVALTASAEVLERTRAAVAWMASDEPFPRTAFRTFGGRSGHRSGDRRTLAWGARLVTLALACVALGSYVVKATAFSLDVPADSAFVTAETRTISVASTGSVIFLNDADSVAQGEPLVGIRTRNGSMRSFDAPFGGKVVARHLSLGDAVRQGDALLTIAAADSKPYVLAFLGPKAVLRMGRGSRALVFLPGSRTVSVPVGAQNIETRIEGEDGSSLIGLRIAVDELDPSLVGRLVDVRFELGSLLDGLDLRL